MATGERMVSTPRPGTCRDQPQTPPHTRVAEIVRVSRPRPQPAIHDLALVRGGVGLELSQLGVADRLEGDPDDPQQRAGREDREKTGGLGHRRHLQRQRHEPLRHSLNSEDLACDRAEAVAAGTLQQVHVSRILASALRFHVHVPGQAQTPDRHEDGQQPVPERVSATDQYANPGDADESESPTRRRPRCSDRSGDRRRTSRSGVPRGTPGSRS